MQFLVAEMVKGANHYQLEVQSVMPSVMTWTSRELDAMSRLCGDTRQVTPICAGCKSDRLSFSYMGVVSCAFLAVSCLLFQRWIQGTSTMTGLIQEHSMGCSSQLSD